MWGIYMGEFAQWFTKNILEYNGMFTRFSILYCSFLTEYTLLYEITDNDINIWRIYQWLKCNDIILLQYNNKINSPSIKRWFPGVHSSWLQCVLAGDLDLHGPWRTLETYLTAVKDYHVLNWVIPSLKGMAHYQIYCHREEFKRHDEDIKIRMTKSCK